ncbi:MAG: peptidoglycan-binding domain-containing protein [Patescibacteria group bacterium]
MKKFLIATGIATLAFASVAAAQAYSFSTNLMVGSTGADVSALQTALINAGFSIPAITSGGAVKGNFGSQTKAAVMAYQASRGIPNTGFVGPLTRAALNGGAVATAPTTPAMGCPVGYVCTPTNPSNPSTPVVTVGGLSGTDGLISDVDELSSYSNEEVGEGQSDVKVLGMDVEASKEGDIRIRSIKVSFSSSGNGSADSDDLDDYLDGVTIWMGSTKVGSADVSSFNEDSSGNWSKTITLSSDAVIRADKTQKIYVAVDAVSTFDSGDIDSDSWSVDVESIRFEDGSGVTTSDTSTGDIDGMDVAIDFASFSSASDTELKFSKDSSSPESSIIVVDDENNTDDVILAIGKIRLDGSSDVTIDELPITFTSSAAAVASTTNSVTLKIGNDTFTETVNIAVGALTGTVTFDNLDYTVEAGETDLKFTVLADINDIELDTFDEGDYLYASFTASNRDMMDAENEEGDALTSSEKTGTVTGDAMEFRTEGIGLTLLSTETDATTGTSANDDIGLFTIKFKITAIGDTMYVSSVATSTTSGYNYVIDKGGVATAALTQTSSIVNNTDTDVSTNGNYVIEDGESENFTLSISVPLGTGGTSGQYRAALTGVKWDTTDVNPATAAYANNYTSDLDTFKTAYKVLN